MYNHVYSQTQGVSEPRCELLANNYAYVITMVKSAPRLNARHFCDAVNREMVAPDLPRGLAVDAERWDRLAVLVRAPVREL